MKNIRCVHTLFSFSRVRREHPNREDYPLHAHEDYELLYLLEGKGRYLVEGREYPLARDSVMIMRPGEVHRLLVDSSTPYERVCINFQPELLTLLDPHHLLLEPYDRRRLGEHNHYSLTCGTDLLSLLPQWRATIEEEALKLSSQMFLFRCLFEVREQFARRQEEGEELPPLEPILHYVNAHLSEELSLHSIAARFYVSPAQLNRIMKRGVGTTFWQYAIVKRLLAAKALMRQGVPTTAAARQCGFEEYSTFYRAYRKQFEVSPGAEQREKRIIP